MGQTSAGNVFILFRGAFPEGSGATDRIHTLASAFSQLGYDTTLVLSRQVPVPAPQLPFRVQFQGIADNTHSSLRKWLHERRCSRQLIRQLKASDKPGILWIYHPDLVFHLPLIRWARRNGWQLYGEQTELNSAVAAVPEMQQQFLYHILARLNEKRLPALFHRWVVITAKMQEYYRHYSPNVVQLGLLLPETRQVFRYREPGYCWGFTGSFGHKDGIPLMLEAFARARKQKPELRLLLTGACPFPEKIREQMAHLHLPEEVVEISGFLPRNTLVERLAQCDGLLITRPDNAYANAGFPQKLATYLDAGRPVLSTYTAGLETLPGIGLALPGSAESVANAILAAYGNWESFEKSGYLFVQAARTKFNAAVSLRRVLGLMDNDGSNNPHFNSTSGNAPGKP